MYLASASSQASRSALGSEEAILSRIMYTSSSRLRALTLLAWLVANIILCLNSLDITVGDFDADTHVGSDALVALVQHLLPADLKDDGELALRSEGEDPR